ncbi:hypothetical protein FACS1894164_11950 [Spirochaetia bacterium]|nr:hypothetical protein FACS1894164_11950 [Spirochaetia bacterium]
MEILRNTGEVKDQLFALLLTRKLTEKKILELREELAKWQNRVELARSAGKESLQKQAESETDNIKAQLEILTSECAALKKEIEDVQHSAAGIAARERSVDPDLLEQELIMAAGYLPGDEEKAAMDRQFAEQEKNSFAQSALESLKAKLKRS